MYTRLLLFFFLWSGSCNGLLKDTLNPNIINKDVVRSIDISSQLIKLKVHALLENVGSSSINSFHIAIESELHESLSFIDASVKTDASSRQPLHPRPVSISNHGDKYFYRLQLRDTVAAKETFSVEIESVFTKRLMPYPAQINQLDKQLVIYNGSPYFFSPYSTVKQVTTINLASANVESYSKLKPVSLSGNTITYGPYKDILAFDRTSVAIHYENNSPFLSVVSLERVIEVSHWGNIAVEEKINVKHVGATLKGSFSRFDFQRGQAYENIPAVKSFKTVLPASAKEVYYRDEIGNISTSHMLQLEDSVELDIRPRFPLFGGWQTHYTLGYNVPSFQYLYSNANSYLLQMRLIDHIFDNCVIENVKLRIILPEGAKNIRFKAPYQVKEDELGLHFTYLDVAGRPVISVHKSNLVEYHIQDFNLHYDFSKMLLLREPLLVVGSLYLLFLVVVVYVRLDFSVIKDEADEARQKIAGILEEIQCLQENRESLYEAFDGVISKFKAQKNSNTFASARKKFDLDFKKYHNDISVFLDKLNSDKAESTLTQQIQDMQSKETERKHLLDHAISLTEMVVAGKIDRDKYMDNLQSNLAKRSKIAEEIAILNSNL